jgi:hypothetical protein
VRLDRRALTVNVRRTLHDEDTLFYRTNGTMEAALPGLHCDGDLVFLRHREGAPQALYASRFRRLSVGEAMDVRADAAIDKLEFSANRCEIMADRGAASRLKIEAREGVTVVVNGEIRRRANR